MGLWNRCWFEHRCNLLVVLNFNFGLGFCFFSINTFLSFSKWSMESDESTTDGSKTMFHKVALPDYNSKFILGEVYRRKVFFNYEKRLRLRSPPEKVFEYFAYFQISKGELFMRPVDIMQAVVLVFPSFESHIVRDGYLTKERKVKNNIKEKN
uniref:Uncharacterized protein n=1 Tax=Gossypium raimondii TaxID=29730 RepID=A0A0D2QNA7_GOSRA|nr:hypothetical protein B456_003G046800 [Gossypium raimondii]